MNVMEKADSKEELIKLVLNNNPEYMLRSINDNYMCIEKESGQFQYLYYAKIETGEYIIVNKEESTEPYSFNNSTK